MPPLRIVRIEDEGPTAGNGLKLRMHARVQEGPHHGLKLGEGANGVNKLAWSNSHNKLFLNKKIVKVDLK